MKKKIGLMVMLAIMLVFGMTVVGCVTALEMGAAALDGANQTLDKYK